MSTNYLRFHCDFYSLIHINCFTYNSPITLQGTINENFPKRTRKSLIIYLHGQGLFFKNDRERISCRKIFFLFLSNNSFCTFVQESFRNEGKIFWLIIKPQPQTNDRSLQSLQFPISFHPQITYCRRMAFVVVAALQHSTCFPFFFAWWSSLIEKILFLLDFFCE